MSVHPSPRLPAAAGEAIPTATGDAAAGGDLFNTLVSGLAGAGTAAAATGTAAGLPSAGDADAEPVSPEATDAAATAAKAVPESVEQLLALVGASRTHAAGKGKEAKGEAKEQEPGDAASPQPQQPAPPTLAVAAPAPSAAAIPPAPAAQAGAAPTPVAIAATPSAATALATLMAAAGNPAANQPTQVAPADPSTGNIPAAPQAVPVAAPAATDVAQAAAPAVEAPAQAAIKSLLAELTAPAAEHRRSDRPLASEASSVIASVRQLEQPAGTNPVQAPLATAQPTDSAPAQPAAAPLQGVVLERQLDLAHQQNWIDQLARDISSVAGGDGGSLRFHLNPEHLGSLHVEIAQGHHGAAIRFSADSEAARSIIADAQPRLIAEARAQGVRISEAHVDLGSGGSGDPRRQATAPTDVQVRTARSLQGEANDDAADGKPTPRRRELYA